MMVLRRGRWVVFAVLEAIGLAGIPDDVQSWHLLLGSMDGETVLRASAIIAGLVVAAGPLVWDRIQGRKLKVVEPEQGGLPSRAQVEEWLAFIDGYEFAWLKTGRVWGGGPFKKNIVYEPMWAEMRPFLSVPAVKEVELTELVFMAHEDQKAKFGELRRLIRRDLGMLLRDDTVGVI